MKKQTQNYLGANVKKIRKKRGLSQDRLAKIADITLTTLVKIETGNNGNPTLNTLTKIASGLEVSVDELIRK